MKRGKELKSWSILLTVVTAGILTLSIANNANFKLFAEYGFGAGGYTCYIPEDETEIRDLITNDTSHNENIYTTRGTVTRVQESETGQSRAFIQRTNGEDGSKSSIMLNDYNSAYLNVVEGNVIDVEGQYFYAAALPFLHGHNGSGDYYQATVAETTNQNPVEAWEMSVDNFKYYMATGSFTYRDISRLVTLHNVAFSNHVSFGKINYYHESIYLPFAVFDSLYLNEGGGSIETISLVLSTYNTANTNNLSDYLAEHTGDNAIFDLTGVITYLSGSNEYALMIVDVADAAVVSEDGGSGGDIEEIMRNLEHQLGREMTAQEKEALPTILTLMGELELDEPTYLLSHDNAAIEERLKRDLEASEIVALTHFRNVMNEIREANILGTIAMLEKELDRLMTSGEKAIVPIIFDLLDNPAIEGDHILMQSDAVIATLLGRPLTPEESNALTLFRAIQIEIKAKYTIIMLESQLKRPLTTDEKAAVPVIISLMVEFNLDEPDALLADDETIEESFDYTLSPGESAALVIYRAIMEEMPEDGHHEGGGMNVEETITMLEEQLGEDLTPAESEAVPIVLDLMMKLNIKEPTELMIADELYEETFGYTLTSHESAALIIFRDIMNRIAASEQSG